MSDLVKRLLITNLLAPLLLAGCSGRSTEVSPAAPANSSTPGPEAPATPQTPSLTARQVIDAFAAAGLPVPEPRDNSKNCASLGCTEMVTTDAVTVLTFTDDATATKYASTFAEDAHRQAGVVLSYAAARTPEADRPLYEAELAKLAGQ